MTDTLSRPARSPLSRPARASGRHLAAGGPAALWAALAGLVAMTVPVLLVWAADGRSGAGAAAAVRTAGQLWLVTHGTALDVPGGHVGLTPLGLTAVPLVLLARAGAHAARQAGVARVRDAVRLTVAVAAPYAVVAAVVAGLSRAPQVVPSPLHALFGGLLLGALGAGAGVVRAAGLWPGLWRRLPLRACGLAVATAAATGVLLAGGALVVGGALLMHAGGAADLARASGPGLVGGLALFVLGVGLVPNAVVWGAAWLAGPGFAVGVGTAVGPFAATLGPVPALPLLAALPGTAPPLWAGLLVLMLPLTAGGVAGLLLLRRLADPSWRRAAGEAALAGPCVGAVLALLAALAGGPLGGGRLAAFGPSPWRVGLGVALEVGVGAAAVAGLRVGLRGGLSRRAVSR